MIQSNIKVVIERLKRVDAGIIEALNNAASPKYWKPRLESVARRELRAQWAQERSLALHNFYERMEEPILRTLMADFFPGGGGAWFSLAIPREAIEQPASITGAAQFNLGQRTPTGRMTKQAKLVDPNAFHPEQAENLDRVRQLILDWVTFEKDLKPERDYKADGTPYSPQELAERIEEILGVNLGAIPGTRSQAMMDAAGELTRAIQSWLDGECATSPETASSAANAAAQAGAGGTVLPPAPPVQGSAPEKILFKPETAHQWLAAVLLAWTAMVRTGLPGRIELALDKLFTRIKQELPLSK